MTLPGPPLFARRCVAVTLLALALAVLALALGCRRQSARPEPDSDDPVWFRDVSDEVGLSFRHEPGPIGAYFMPQIMGSGAAWLDFDNDGLLDLYLIQNAGPRSGTVNRLFRQLPGGRFEDVSSGSGLDIAGHGMGVAVGDLDNDGWVDVYVSQYGGGRLFRNRGKDRNGRWLGYEDMTVSASVEQPRWGTSCSFVDYDRDGWLDLVVVNYVDYDPSRRCRDAAERPDYCHPNQFAGTVTRLFRNRGKDTDGRWRGYQDVTVKSGLSKAPGPGLGVACADFTGDGWPDILVANDAQANHLWVNQRDGTFTEEAVPRGLAFNVLGHAQANMGVALGDTAGSGLLDVFVTHLTEESHTLWRQRPRGSFRDQTAASGLARPRWRGTGFGTVLIDFDHDGALDLAIVNGRVARAARKPRGYWDDYSERNQLFVNDGSGVFRDVSAGNTPFCGTAGVYRGLAWADADNDGSVDLLITQVAGPALLFRNVAHKRGRWLGVRAIDPALKRDAYGATVTVESGKRRWVGLVCPGQSYLCSGDPRVHFGLGTVEKVDRVRIDWPDGVVEEFSDVGLDQHVILKRGQGRRP